MAKSSILFYLLILFVISKVSSKSCYTCYTGLDKHCKTKPAQEKYVEECTGLSGSEFSISQRSNPILSPIYKDFESDLAIDYQCAVVTYTNVTTGQRSLARGCLPTYIRDDSLRILSLAAIGIQTDDISRCNNDLCNSY